MIIMTLCNEIGASLTEPHSLVPRLSTLKGRREPGNIGVVVFQILTQTRG